MPVNLVIFDLDGTLVDTSRDLTNAVNFALRECGLREISKPAVISMVGGGIENLIETMLGPEGAHMNELATKSFTDYYCGHISEYSTTYPHVEEVMDVLRPIKKAVLSNKREDMCIEILADLRLLGFFDMVVGGDTLAEMKPSAAPVRHIMDALGVAPEDTVMVGDSSTDIATARGAGITSVAVSYGFRSRESLRDADHVIDSMLELVPILYGMNPDVDRRTASRYKVPAIYKRYIRITVETPEGAVDVPLLDFSERGFMVLSPGEIRPAERFRCTVSIPRSLTHEVSFTALCRHTVQGRTGYMIGAEIESVDSRLWFRVFMNVLDHLMERQRRGY